MCKSGPCKSTVLFDVSSIDGRSNSIDYAKKKDKRAQIKVIKDETVQKDDVYKSHAIHVPSGEPPNSVSRPPAKRKPGIVRPITEGKLLKAGGPSVRITKPACLRINIRRNPRLRSPSLLPDHYLVKAVQPPLQSLPSLQ